MLQEYAVEPAAIGEDWESFVVMIERFGADKGKLISQWPYKRDEKWISKVMSVAKGNPAIGDVKLSSMKKRMRRPLKIADFGRNPDNLDSTQNWSNNINNEHKRRPYHLAICKDKVDNNDLFVTASEYIDDSEQSAINSSCNVKLSADAIAEALFPVALISNEIDIIDPYFNLTSINTGRNYLTPLKLLFDKLKQVKTNTKTFRLHLSWDQNSASEKPDTFLKNNKAAIHQHIPSGYVVELIAWSAKPNSQKFHNRYCLTDIVGLQSGEGFAEEDKSTNDKFSLLSEMDRKKLLEQFADDSNAYQRVGKIQVTSSMGEPS